MVSFVKSGIVLVVITAAVLQLPLIQRFIRLLRLGLAIGKDIRPISDFTHQCHRVHDPLLEACEDMWISAKTRTLYLACSDPKGRGNWMPNEAQLNLVGRSTRDRIVAMNLDTLDFQQVPMTGFTGTRGDGLFNVVGFTGSGMEISGTELLYVTNFRPSVDPATGQVLPDQTVTGANATVEVFKVVNDAGTSALEWVRTIADDAVTTPNRVVAIPERGIYVTNDHGNRKTGIRSQLSPLLETGNIAFCPASPRGSACEIVSTGHAYPNGLIQSRFDNLIYVPCSAQGGIKVFKSHENGSLEWEGHIDIPYAIDNLSEDEDGTIWAAAIPHGPKFFQHTKDPFGYIPPSAVFTIQKLENGEYEWQKVLEDRDGEVLPGTTTVVHDVIAGRLFMSGGFSPFITICDSGRRRGTSRCGALI